MKGYSSGHCWQDRDVNLDWKAWRQLHFDEVSQLLEMLELRSDHLQDVQQHLHCQGKVF